MIASPRDRFSNTTVAPHTHEIQATRDLASAGIDSTPRARDDPSWSPNLIHDSQDPPSAVVNDGSLYLPGPGHTEANLGSRIERTRHARQQLRRRDRYGRRARHDLQHVLDQVLGEQRPRLAWQLGQKLRVWQLNASRCSPRQTDKLVVDVDMLLSGDGDDFARARLLINCEDRRGRVPVATLPRTTRRRGLGHEWDLTLPVDERLPQPTSLAHTELDGSRRSIRLSCTRTDTGQQRAPRCIASWIIGQSLVELGEAALELYERLRALAWISGAGATTLDPFRESVLGEIG